MSLTLSLLLSILLSLSCLTLSIGSWLETNDLFYSTSAGQDMAIIRLLLYKKTSNESKVLTFGLWRYCLWDAASGSSKCSPVNIKYNPDFLSIFQSLARNQIVNTNSSSNSYVRFAPLLLSSILSIVAFIISLFLLRFNARITMQRCAFLIVIGSLSIINSVICSISFGMTYHSYFSNIKRLCTSGLTTNNETTNIFSCSSYTVKDESILLSVTIGIQVITFIYSIFCFYQTRHLAIVQQKNQIVSQPPLFLNSTVHSEKTDIVYKREKEEPSKSLSETEFWSEHPTENTYSTQLSLRPRPVSTQLNYAGRRSKEITCHSAPKTNEIHLNPGTIKTNGSDITTNGSIDIYTSTSSLSLGEGQLAPPRRPFASKNVYNGSGNRPLSYGSDNTFGIIAATKSDNASQVSSIGQGGSGSNVSSSIIYSSNENPATQSNHTLGTFLNGHTINTGSCYSFEEDMDQEGRLKPESEQVINKDAPMIPSNYIYDLPASEILSKRINDYLQPQKQNTFT